MTYQQMYSIPVLDKQENYKIDTECSDIEVGIDSHLYRLNQRQK